MAAAVVVDTMVASAWLGVRETPRKIRWAPILQRLNVRQRAARRKGVGRASP
jgi:hypothetical protein